MTESEAIRVIFAAPIVVFAQRTWLVPGTDAPQTYDDLLDFFEVAGCDQGHIMCPVCCEEFVPRRPRKKK